MLGSLARRRLFHKGHDLFIDTSTRYTQLEFHKRLDRIQAALPAIASQQANPSNAQSKDNNKVLHLNYLVSKAFKESRLTVTPALLDFL